nr:ubiquitin-conjugating enzyme E2 Z-like [Dermacentor andersoni]
MASQAGASTLALTEEDVPQACLLRVKRDIADFNADPPPGIFIAPEEKSITNIHAIVMGAPNTPHEGGFFHFHVRCTSDYPLKPPNVRCLTTDAGRTKFNEHIYLDGFICLSTLNTHGSGWSPAQSVSSLLVSIQSLLSEIPAFTQKEAVDRFESIIQHETIRVAVCDTVEACLQEDSPFPETLKDAVFKKFAELYDKYEDVVKSRLHLTGTNMNDPMRMNTGTYQFENLLTRLQDLKGKVAEKNEAAAATADQ